MPSHTQHMQRQQQTQLAQLQTIMLGQLPIPRAQGFLQAQSPALLLAQQQQQQQQQQHQVVAAAAAASQRYMALQHRQMQAIHQVTYLHLLICDFL